MSSEPTRKKPFSIFDDNPFEQLDLNPMDSPRKLTQKLKQKVMRKSPQEREPIQKRWQQLTRDQWTRMRYAILAHPRSTNTASIKEQRPFQPSDALDPLHLQWGDLLLSPHLSTPTTTSKQTPTCSFYTGPLPYQKQSPGDS